MNTQEQIIFNTANRLLAGTKTAAICIELADGKSAYLGDDAGVMRMLQNKDQIGAAVRGEAVAMTDEEIDIVWQSMPGGPSHWLKGFGYQNFARAIECEYQLKSARAADAPSEPSELTELDLAELEYVAKKADPIHTDLYGDRYSQGSWSRVDLDKEQDDFIAAFKPATVLALIAAVKSRAADALDSQPTDEARALRAGINLLDYAKRAGWPDDGEGAFEFLQRKFYAAGMEHAASSQPTDGGVRNG